MCQVPLFDPIRNANLDAEAVVNAMSFDKKVKSSKIRFILPNRIGHVTIRDDVAPQLVLDAVKRIVAA